MMSGLGNGHHGALPLSEARLIEIDLSDLGLSADLSRPDQVALATAHVYERFVAYADEGWEWVTFPGSPEFEGWVVARNVLMAVRLLSRRAEVGSAGRAAHGVSAYRTSQLTGRPWTAEPGSKLWRSIA